MLRTVMTVGSAFRKLPRARTDPQHVNPPAPQAGLLRSAGPLQNAGRQAGGHRSADFRIRCPIPRGFLQAPLPHEEVGQIVAGMTADETGFATGPAVPLFCLSGPALLVKQVGKGRPRVRTDRFHRLPEAELAFIGLRP